MTEAWSQWGIWLASQPDSPLRLWYIRSTQPKHGLCKGDTACPLYG